MDFPIEFQSIEGAEQLCKWFGYWPNFHDAEVIRLHLNRRAPSSLVLHTWEMTKQVDERGYHVLGKHVIVEFIMNDIVGLSLNGINQQNVIFGLKIEKRDEGILLSLDDCHSISGTIETKDLTIRLTPGKPNDI